MALRIMLTDYGCFVSILLRQQRDLKLISDPAVVREILDNVVNENLKELESYKAVSYETSSDFLCICARVCWGETNGNAVLPAHFLSQQGKKKLFGFFVGKALAATGGRADPGVINEMLKDVLGS